MTRVLFLLVPCLIQASEPPKRVYVDCAGSSGVSTAARNKLVPAVGYWGPDLAPYGSFTLKESDTVYFHPALLSSAAGDDDDGLADESGERFKVYMFDPASKLSAARWAGCFQFGGAELTAPPSIKESEGDAVS